MTSARYVRLAVLLAVLLVGFSSVTYADTTPVDPKMVVSDPTCGPGCTVVEGTTFTFSSNGIGGESRRLKTPQIPVGRVS